MALLSRLHAFLRTSRKDSCRESLEPYRQVIAADLDAEIVKARDFEDGSVWWGLMDHARVLGEQEIREALLFSEGYARKLLPPFENTPK